MRISIWQQFSSNHSANYDVVGTFASEKEAQQVAEKFKQIFLAIKNWWWNSGLSQDEFQRWFDHVEIGQPTPIELELGEEYGIEWKHGLNWFSWVSWEHSDLPISVFEKSVFIQNPHWYLWYGPQPLNQLMEIFGAEVAVAADECRTYPDTCLLTNLACLAPDEQKTQELYDLFQTQFTNYRNDTYENLTGLPFNCDPIFWEFVNPAARIFELEIEGAKLKFYGLDFEIHQKWYWQPLKTFIQYLESHNCTEIQYVFLSEQLLPQKPEDTNEDI